LLDRSLYHHRIPEFFLLCFTGVSQADSTTPKPIRRLCTCSSGKLHLTTIITKIFRVLLERFATRTLVSRINQCANLIFLYYFDEYCAGKGFHHLHIDRFVRSQLFLCNYFCLSLFTVHRYHISEPLREETRILTHK